MKKSVVCSLLSVVLPAVLFLAASVGSQALGSERPAIPDLTKGGKPDATHDWTLGPTGARGWIWGWQRQTTDARQILITETTEGSPCDGILEKGDVLLGINRKLFTYDARIQLARAITEAEKFWGTLSLVRWRDGESANVKIKLDVLGSYSATAPYHCQKSKRILELGCKAIAREGFKDERGDIQVSITHDLNALALLASGLTQYRALVAEYAHKVAEYQPGGYVSWSYAYSTLFLAEYALATKHRAVMPGLNRLALDIARGQSGVGTWGHRFARPEDGILNGYGAMNQPGIVLTLAMAVAREAGVQHPDLDRAIENSALFLRWYVDKGSIPYGDHRPWKWHDDNGKNSSAAILYDLLGDEVAAGYFSRMATAAYNERESGHTGNFFGHLWSMPGVSRSGKLATGAYMKEQAWYYDLARTWDGRFVYQPTPGDCGGHAYNLWDCTGAYLLAYALPLKRTIVTGRKPCVVKPLTREAVAETIAAGRNFTFWTEKTAYDGLSTDRLLAGLASWSPSVRKRSAEALGRRSGDVVPHLIQMIDGHNRYARYGACEALAHLGQKADQAVSKEIELLADPDPWMRFLAADAIVCMGPMERTRAVPELLRAIGAEDPADPRQRVDEAYAEALFAPPPSGGPQSILAKSLEGLDRSALYAAIRDVLKNEDARIRSLIVPVYKMLTPKDIAVLMPDIIEAIKKPAPSGVMYGYAIRKGGLDLLTSLHIREGMQMCLDIMGEFRWGRKMNVYADYLARYRGSAREVLPELRKLQDLNKKSDRGPDDKRKDAEALEKLIAKIMEDKKEVSLVSVKDFRERQM